jgi:hypothetical protein
VRDELVKKDAKSARNVVLIRYEFIFKSDVYDDLH